MRIAFDVKGTIQGPYQDKVLRLFRAFEKRGHEMIVWSSVYSYATDAVAKHGLNARPMSKMLGCEASSNDRVNICIDDERQTWLATDRLILVSELPDDVEALAEEISAEFIESEGGIHA